MRTLVRLVARARILAAALAIGAAVAASLGAWGIAIGLAVVAASTALLVSDEVAPLGRMGAAAEGATIALARLSKEMNLEGAGIVLPADIPGETRVFIPARGDQRVNLTAIDSLNALQRHREGAIGLLLPAPGSALEREWAEIRPSQRGEGPEAAAGVLREAMPALGLGRRVRLARSGDRIRVTYESAAFAALCRSIADEHAPWHLQGGCPACSFVAATVARATGEPMRIVDAGREGSEVHIEMEVLARTAP